MQSLAYSKMCCEWLAKARGRKASSRTAKVRMFAFCVLDACCLHQTFFKPDLTQLIPFFMFAAFYHAVDWKEGWIQGVLVFHVLTACAVVLTRKQFRVQVALFLTVCALIRTAEWCNTQLSQRWQSFSTQNYFDERGVFMAVMWCGPLFISGFFMMINFVRTSANLMVTVKRAQLREQIAERKAQSAKAQ
jgi:transmembrane protein 18